MKHVGLSALQNMSDCLHHKNVVLSAFVIKDVGFSVCVVTTHVGRIACIIKDVGWPIFQLRIIPSNDQFAHKSPLKFCTV